MAETTPPTGVDQSLQDMAASWQPLIDSVNQRRQPAPATPEVQRENPFTGIFRGARSGLINELGTAAGRLIGLKDRFSRASASPAAEQQLEQSFFQRAYHKKVFGISVADVVTSAWESKTELAAGALAGYAAKEAAKTAASFFLPGGILVRAGVGALGGAAAAAAKETVSGVRAYNQFKADLEGRLRANLQIQAETPLESTSHVPEVVKSLHAEYDRLQSQLQTETDPRKRELVSDHLRYLGYYIKKQEWRRSNREGGAKAALNEFLAYGGSLTDTQRAGLEKEILGSDRVDKTRLRRRVLRGAAFGAAGAIAGGLLVDWLSSHLEAAPSPLPAAGATPAVAAETATPEPPKPPATAVPAEPSPAVPSQPAIAPEVQAAAPSASVEPQPSAAAPQAPVSPAESLPPTTAPTGAEVQGSTLDNSLTYDGKPWVLMDNGVKNIGNLFNAVGESGDIDNQALASSLQKATALWAQGQLSPSTDPDLYKIFHLSNGTASLYNNLLQNDTLESLKKLGIVIRK